TSDGIAESQEVTDFSENSPGGGTLDTDGTSIFVTNGQVINPADLSIKSTVSLQLQPSSMRVDVPTSRVYFAGFGVGFPGNARSQIQAYDLATLKLQGLLSFPEFGFSSGLFRWSSNGLALIGQDSLLFFRTSLTGNAVAQLAVAGTMNASVGSGQT